MKGLIVTAGHHLELAELPAPEPGPYEALVRIRACGICATTDRELIRGTQPYNKAYPCLLGHEAVGEVVTAGARVRSFARGDLVTRPVGIWPGTTRAGLASAWGGFAEYGVVRDRLAMAADGDRSLADDYTALRQNRIDAAGLDDGALVLAISLAETLSWSWQLGPLGGATVAVAGTGIAGLSIALWARLAGARHVVVLGRRAERLELARRVAADHAFDTGAPGWERALAQAVGAPQVFCDAVGSPELLRAAAGLVAPGGLLAAYGVPPPGAAPFDPATLGGGRRFAVPEAREHLAYAQACELIRRGAVPARLLMTHAWPLADFAAAFAAVEAGGVVKGRLVMG